MIPAFIAAATFIAFLPGLRGGFIWDDRTLLVLNAGFRGLDWPRLKWMFTNSDIGLYMPLTWLSYALDFQLWGLDPFGFHLTNLLLHSLNAALFYGIALRLLEKAAGRSPALPWAAAFAALLFSIHPLRVESVSWITERRDVLSGFFYLLTIRFYLESRKKLGLACFAGSLMAKSSGVALPFVLMILDHYPLEKKQGGKLPYFTLALGAVVIGVFGQESSGALRSGAELSLYERLGQAAYGLMFYFTRTIFPLNLMPFYERPKAMGLLEPGFMNATALVCGLTAAAVIFRRSYPAFLAAWTAYALTLAPVLGLVPIGLQLVADRYSYLSCLPWPLLAAGGLLKSGFSLPTRAIVAGVLLFLGVMTSRQSELWKDEETLWTDAARTGGQAYAYNKLGNAKISKGKTEEAIQNFESALRAVSTYANAAYNMGAALVSQGKLDAAMSRYLQALRLDPSLAAAHVNIAAILHSKGRPKEAFEELEAAVRADPNYAPARANLGSFLAFLGRKPEAEAQFREALRLNPSNQEARRGLEGLRRP